ncbi:MAG: helix-turn-helix domain-containing protein [Enhydrobacter sp.]|nr:MAG: helix-turn-helix domain-containing protein [Enhydrobacter sp.]
MALGAARRWSKGDVLFEAGTPTGHFYKVTKGLVAIFRLFEDGRRQIVGIHTIGDLCGYIEHNGTYHFSGVALTDVEACGFDRRRFTAFAARHADLASALAEDMTEKLRRTGESMAVIGQLKASERVGYFLLQLSGIYADRMGAKPPLRLNLSRQEIADYLGLSLETVSRAFTKLKNRGFVVLIGHDEVAIVDRQRLADFVMLEVTI